MDPATHLGTATVTAAYRAFGEREARGVSPVYEAWALGVAEDAVVADLIATLPRGKRQPNLVLAAARWHGARGDYDDLRSTLLGQWPQVRATVLARATQTNEANRCAVLLPFLAELPQPLALLEVGAAAGLCLLPDRYSYRYDDGTALDPDDGPADVVLPCALGPGVRAPRRLPQVAWRAGIDLAPVDVSDDDACAWLEALVWPEHDERRTRLRAALDVARRDPPRVVPGDLLDVLPALAAEAPRDATLVVLHSAVLAYLDAGARAAFVDLVGTLPGHWVSNEGARVLPMTADLVPGTGGRDFVVVVDGVARGYADPHGRSLTGLGGRDATSAD
ncbi:DUF2332 domain-containing protein [Cellulomonas shaoxiangyii]|uniref:DUF2332 domain-containing protein n=1 Tax=Cellulomonas shaoxiangyii TaxID=2566013 RepID=A0A4P7SKG6_9CELL|nr:DUF2332 domain-containing protein [Cellulomonas shaoxiangyii]QCB94789.1 DUF2332 domain-containing protein [Cellulomonas shaoxiangyii]TGY86519.1 DUF2332 domain-containing protein [Cellulomonas shaoxiangyii]